MRDFYQRERFLGLFPWPGQGGFCRAKTLAAGLARRGLFLAALTERLRPKRVSLELTPRCNLKCGFCDLWARPPYPSAFGAGDWAPLLEQIRERLPFFSVSSWVGEPLLALDAIEEISTFCAAHGLAFSCATNGTLLDEAAARRLSRRPLTQLRFSMDSLSPELHDRARGVPGAHAGLMVGLKEASRRGCARRIEISSVVLKENAGELGTLVRWAEQNSLSGVLFHPMQPRGARWRELMPGAAAAAEALDEVAELKRRGYPVRNSFGHLERMKAYYAAPLEETEPSFCLSAVVARIRQNGDLLLCPNEPPVGNVRKDGFWGVWDSPAARAAAVRAARCRKPCGAHSCHFQPGLPERIGEFFKRETDG